MDGDKVYYNRTSNTLLMGNQYAIVGPRAITYFGTVKGSLGTIGPQSINLGGPNYVNSTGAGLFPAVGTQIKTPLVIIAAGTPPTSWSKHPNGIGMNVSEPLFSNTLYYPEPTVVGPETDGVAYWYDNPTTPTGTFLDNPLESKNLYSGATGDPNSPLRPLAKQGLLATGTTTDYKTVVLQRLANPSMAFDPVTNPYRTVDWMPVDLTVFNGEDTKPPAASWPPLAWMNPKSNPTQNPNFATYQEWDPDDPNYDANVPATQIGVCFMSRQRGGWGEVHSQYLGAILADQHVPLPPERDRCQRQLSLRLVQLVRLSLNTTYWPTYQTTVPLGPTSPAPPPTSIANNVRTDGPYVGDPKQPFPWITWNNRPYISEYELLQVPACSAARLPIEFGTASIANIPYQPTSLANMPFPHLPDFFWSEQSSGVALGVPAAPQLYRLLQYVGVPSRMAGCEIFANPNFAYNAGSHFFHPPFNRIPRYREPGKINLNTIYSQDVWNGLINFFPGMVDPASIRVAGGSSTLSMTNSSTASAWSKFVQSRRAMPGAFNYLLRLRLPPWPSTPWRWTIAATIQRGSAIPSAHSPAATWCRPCRSCSSPRKSRPRCCGPTRSTPNKPLFQFDPTLALTTSGANPNLGPFNDPDKTPSSAIRPFSG